MTENMHKKRLAKLCCYLAVGLLNNDLHDLHATGHQCRVKDQLDNQWVRNSSMEDKTSFHPKTETTVGKCVKCSHPATQKY